MALLMMTALVTVLALLTLGSWVCHLVAQAQHNILVMTNSDWLVVPRLWPLVAVTASLRAMAAWATSEWILDDPLTSRRWWLIPLQDMISFFVWILGRFGSAVEWRGRRYGIFQDGRLRFLDDTTETAEKAQPAFRAPPATFRQSGVKAGAGVL